MASAEKICFLIQAAFILACVFLSSQQVAQFWEGPAITTLGVFFCSETFVCKRQRPAGKLMEKLFHDSSNIFLGFIAWKESEEVSTQ